MFAPSNATSIPQTKKPSDYAAVVHSYSPPVVANTVNYYFVFPAINPSSLYNAA